MELDPQRFFDTSIYLIKEQRRLGMSQQEMIDAQIPPWLIFFCTVGRLIPLQNITPERLSSVMKQGGTDHPDPTLGI
jgi:hypothetical protein